MSVDMVFADGRRRLVFHPRPLLVPTSDDGLFPRNAVVRRVFSDAVCMLGAGTALLLQLAHPSIAQGVHDHSDYENRPLDRLFGTLYATFTVGFGSQADVERIRSAMRGVHARVTGPTYRALDPELLMWVNATLVGTAADLYQRMIRPLTPDERDEFARDARVIAEVFGCPIDGQPGTWAEFQAYWDRTVACLEVSPTARGVARSLLSGKGLPLRPAWAPILLMTRAVTAATLPAHVRDGYGLPWGRTERAVASATLGTARAVMPRVPERWRQLGPELFRSPSLVPA